MPRVKGEVIKTVTKEVQITLSQEDARELLQILRFYIVWDGLSETREIIIQEMRDILVKGEQ